MARTSKGKGTGRGKASGRARSEPDARAEGEVRRSQLLTSYGPGALIDLVDHAVIVGGVDHWHWGHREPDSIDEPRLRDALMLEFAKSTPPRVLDTQRPFVTPPIAGEPATRSRGIEALLFPRWFVCKSCRALVGHKGLLDPEGGPRVHECGGRRKGDVIPVRFIGMCPRGHVQDYPWLPFVHEAQQVPRCANPQLSFDEGPTGDFAEIVVRCECGAQRRLAEAMAPGAEPDCQGERPWLGPEAREHDCDRKLRLQVRTASNGYFAQVVSALSIPPLDSGLEDAIDRVKEMLADVADERDLASLCKLAKPVRLALEGFTHEAVIAELQRRREGRPVARDKLRVAEFRRFVAAPDQQGADLPERSDTFFVRRLRAIEPLPRGLQALVAAHALREVRALVGFTRIEPSAPNLEGEYDLGVAVQPVGLHTSSLPAIEVRGEGIFVQLDEDEVARWEVRPEVVARSRELAAGWQAWKSSNFPDSPLEFPGARFYLIHTLAHLLISAISLECGYAASAIRERIYCAPADAELPMAALLLSTGTAGSEGTLGGLVEQGSRVAEHLRRAWELGTLCSNDPLCGSHSPAGDHAERHLEGAACHGCVFVAEPSCERNNGFLDRALVVPTIGHARALAFFADRP